MNRESVSGEEIFPEEGVDFSERVASVEKRLLSTAMERAGGV